MIQAYSGLSIGVQIEPQCNKTPSPLPLGGQWKAYDLRDIDGQISAIEVFLAEEKCWKNKALCFRTRMRT